MPRTKIKANKLIILIVIPTNGRHINAPRNANGSPTKTQRAKRICRKSPKIKKTRIAPRTIFSIRISNWPCKIKVVSPQVASSTPLGSVRFLSVTYFLTASAIFSSLSFSVDWTLTLMLGLPLNRDKNSNSTNPSLISAISPKVKTVPSGLVSNTILANSSSRYA